MSEPSEAALPPEEAGSRFADISTRQSILASPDRLLRHYSKAILAYLRALLQDDEAVEDVSLAFAEKIHQGKFGRWQPGPGKKFRYYLKRAVHNAAIDYFRQQPRREVTREDLDRFSDPDTDPSPWGQVWINEWRRAVVNGALERLRAYQQQHPGNCYFTLIRLLEAQLLEGGADRLSSPELAAALARETGRPCTEANARKLKSRALQKFAELLREEVWVSLGVEEATAEEVDGELAQLGLAAYIRDFLPDAEQAGEEE
jgi:RNA polymerase sigma factor (sigma-70 family)